MAMNGNIRPEHYFEGKIGTFVEVGAYDGNSWSSTKCLVEAGWTGLMIEPVPKHVERCRRNHSENPKVTIIESACGTYDGTVTIYYNSSLSTTSKDMVLAYQQVAWANSSLNNPIEVPMARLSTLLENHNWPSRFDLLVVDTEGTELDVLKGLDWSRWSPAMAIIECCEKHPDVILRKRAPGINKWMMDLGYTKVRAGKVNSIFIRGE